MVHARSALAAADDERALRSNPLLAHLEPQRLGHDRLRAHVLRALEFLDPGSRADVASERRGRQHTILLRCDLQRKGHEEVAASLGLSRRQFYRDRRTALLAFAASLRADRVAPPPVAAEPRDVRLLYIETLRDSGKYDAVWRESVRALRELQGDPREAELWTVAAEAARFFGNVRKSQEAIDALRRLVERGEHSHLRRATIMRLAICETALDWMQADFTSGRARVDRVTQSCGDERTMHGRDATLYGILLNYGAWMALDAGDWAAAGEFTRRGERIAKRSEVAHASTFHHRLRGLLAVARNGDLSRASIELRDALAVAKTHKALAPIASASVELGLALDDAGREGGADYVRYGLAIGRDACGYDDFAVLAVKTVPVLLARATIDRALERVEGVRARSPLFRRADLLARLAESKIMLAAGKHDEAATSGADVACELERASLLPSAAEANLLATEALWRGRRVVAARRSLRRAGDMISHFAGAPVRERAAALGGYLALPAAR
jgi:hypothetical protein